tara:strand:+ start:142 stop:519 length:378 start_codon:yes stop_codon:yes gene_type:complete
MLRNGRENFLMGAIICIVMGAFLTVGGVYSMGATIGVSGLVLFVVGMSMKTQHTMTPEEIQNWTPEAVRLPDANRVMFRIDTTLDEPIRTSVLCGPCGKVTLVEGVKPAQFSCPECETHLWDEEE